MKKFLSLMLVVLMAVVMLSMSAFATDAALPEAEVQNLGKVSVGGIGSGADYEVESYYVYDLLGNQPSKLTDSDAFFEMQVAMQFVATDTPEEAAENFYGDYTTDFFIQIDGIENGSFVADGCFLAGYYESYGAWVKIPLDGFTVENGGVYPVITGAGIDYSYVDICSSVENFKCGISFTPEVLAANPDMSVTLSLGLSETIEKAGETDFITVDSYTYDADELLGFVVKVEKDMVANIVSGNTGVSQQIVEEIVADIQTNAALQEEDYAPTNLPEGAKLVLTLTEMDVSDSVPTAITYDVTPMANGIEVDPTDDVQFRLPVPSGVEVNGAKVYHEGELMGTYPVQTSNAAKFVEVTSGSFSLYTMEFVKVVTTYDELVAALAAGEDVVLGADIYYSNGYNDGKTLKIAAGNDITIDLNGYTLGQTVVDNGLSVAAIAVRAGATLTIQDNSAAQTGKISACSTAIQLEGTLNLESGTIAIDNPSKTDLNPEQGCAFGVWFYMRSADAAAPVFNMTGGAIEISEELLTAHATYDFANAVAFGGGSSGIDACYDEAVVNITGGTLNSNIIVGANAQNITVPAGVEVVYYGAVEVVAVAKIGDDTYATLADALANAVDGDTILLLGDLTLAAGDIDARDNIKIPAGVTLDGGNYTLTVEQAQDCDHAVIWSEGAYTLQNVTIKILGEREAVRSVVGLTNGGVVKNVIFDTAPTMAEAVTYDKINSDITILIDGCTFKAPGYAMYADTAKAGTPDITWQNNTFECNRFGSAQNKENIINNTFTSTCAKGISIGVNFDGVVSGNVFEGTGRALSVYGTQTISGNNFGDTYVELNNGAVADLSGNYWGGEAPTDADIKPDGASAVVSYTVTSYYADAELTQLVTIQAGLSGSGTETDPYVIMTAADMFLFAEKVNDGSYANNCYVVLGADIDLDQEDWTSITKFLGTFDGQEYTISNVWCTPDSGNAGFFKQVAEQTEYVSGTVKNVTFNNVTIIASGQSSAGLIADAHLGARVDNVKLTGEVTIQGYRGVGGIVGNGFPVISNCTVEAEGTIYATYWGAGAILGFANDSGAKAIDNTVIGVGDGLTVSSYLGGVGAVTGTPYGAATDGAIVKNVEISSSNNYCMGYVDAGGAVTDVTVEDVSVKVNGEEIIGCDAVAAIGTTPYFTFADALAAAQNGDTVTLCADIDVGTDCGLIRGKEITIDLNGHNITGSGDKVLFVDLLASENKNCKLTLIGEGTVENTGTNKKSSYAVYVGGNSELVVEEGVALKSDAGYSVVLMPLGAGRVSTLTMNGGTIAGRYGVSGNGGARDVSTVINVNGGTISGTEVAIYHPQPGTLTVNGGIITGGTDAAIAMRSGDAVITGGEVAGLVDVLGDYAASTVAINGGDFTNATLQYAEGKGNVVTKADTVTLAAPEGYEWDDTGVLVEVVEIRIPIISRNMILGNDLTMLFWYKKADFDGQDYYALITKTYADGRADVTTKVPLADWNADSATYYKVPYSGVAAKEMSDIVKIQLFTTEDVAVSDVYETTIRDYAMYILTHPETYTASDLTMAADMLNYGAEAQKAFGYNTGDLANAQFTAEDGYKYETTVAPTLENKVNAELNYYGGGLELESNLGMVMWFQNANTYAYDHAVATYVDHYGNTKSVAVTMQRAGNYLKVYVNTLAIADARQVVRVEIFDADDNVVAAGEDSVESIACRDAANTKYGALYTAIMKFADAAYTAFHN